MISSGTLYVFSVYSPSFAQTLGYSGKQIACIVTIGGYASSFSGIFFGNYVDKYPTRFVSALASVLGFVGYFFMALTYDRQLYTSSFLVMGFFYMLVGLSSSASYFSALTTNIRNIELKNRGLIVGLLSSASGLSALIFTQFDNWLFVHKAAEHTPGSNTYSFLVFMAIALGSINLLAVFLLHKIGPGYTTVPPIHSNTEEKSMEFITSEAEIHPQYPSKVLNIHSPVTSSPNGDRRTSSFAAATASHTHTEFPKGHYHSETFLAHHNVPLPIEDPIDVNQTKENRTSTHEADIVTVPLESHLSLIDFILSMEFWMLFGIVFFGAGAAYMFINNVGTMVVALSTTDDSVLLQRQINMQVSIFSLLNCVGRLFFGFLSDLLLRRFSIDRVWLSLFALISMGTMQLLAFFTDTLDRLTLINVLLAFSYGCLYSLTPTIISEQFGETEFGRNWGLLSCGGAFGASLSNIVFGVVYDHHRKGQTVCHGNQCFQISFLYSLAGCSVTICMTTLLLIRRRHRVAWQ